MGRLTERFAPKEREFFDLFEAAGANILRSGELLDRMLEEWPDQGELAAEIVACEHEGDRITHNIFLRLNSTLEPPIDREDIYRLASGLDDIVDYIEEAADFLDIYRIEAPMTQAQQLAGVLHRSCGAICAAIPRLRGFKDTHDCTVEVNRLENDGDRILREALVSLFDHGTDPMLVIRWKDIFDRLESAVDATERAANILEGIVIRNS